MHAYATDISTKVLRKHHKELKHLPPDDLERALEKLIIAEMSGAQPQEPTGPVYGTGRQDDGDVKDSESESESESESSEPEYVKPKKRKPSSKRYTSQVSDSESSSDSDFEGY